VTLTLADLQASLRSLAGPVEHLSQAQNLTLLCPNCFVDCGPDSAHEFVCWFVGRGVTRDLVPSQRWEPRGTGLSDITLRPVHSPPDPCHEFFHITSGRVLLI
jgi:hypothetical protein